MDLKLVERFVLALSPPEGKTTVNTAFEIMRSHPVSSIPALGTMIGQFQHLIYNSGETEQVTFMKILLTGVMIAQATEVEEIRVNLVENFLKRNALLRGENIIDFNDRKAGR